MCKQNTKSTVPLDVAPERRTRRFPRGSLLRAKVQIPIVTGKQAGREGGRDKSAPRPYFFKTLYSNSGKLTLYLQI